MKRENFEDIYGKMATDLLVDKRADRFSNLRIPTLKRGGRRGSIKVLLKDSVST